LVRVAPQIDGKIEGTSALQDGVSERSLVLSLGAYDTLVRDRGKFCQSPEDWISSIVWLELHREGDDSSVDFPTFGLSRLPEIGGAFPKREVDAVGIGPPKLDRGIAHCLVEGEPNLFKDAGGETSKSGWEYILKSQCDDILASLTINLSENSVRAIVSERPTLQLKLSKLFFSSLD
jgi:hypothetical protein